MSPLTSWWHLPKDFSKDGFNYPVTGESLSLGSAQFRVNALQRTLPQSTFGQAGIQVRRQDEKLWQL